MTTATAPVLPDARRRWHARDAAAVAALLAGTLVIYLRTARFPFVNFDDQVYVYQNSHVLAGLTAANVAWACKAIVSANWHPLTLLAELTISSLFGARPGPFHVVNLLLHATNVCLLFAFLRRATGRFWPAGLAAALWGFHPLRVESVAWVSELKDVLCGTCTLLALLAYARYAARRTAGRYAAVAGLFALALLAKPMAVTVPAVLLLLDYWPLGRADGCRADRRWWLARLLEKVPLAAVAVADIAYALRTQFRSGSAGSLVTFPPGARAANAVVSVAAYLRQTVWPTGLAPFYPHPSMLGRHYPVLTVAVSTAVVVVVTAAAVAAARRRPAVAVGWFWFLVMLVPVLGIFQIGEQARADRYTYLPAIGLTVAVVWACAALRPAAVARAAGVVGGVAAAALLAASVVTVGYWRDTQSLFAHAAAVVPDNYNALIELADLSLARGDTATATRLAGRAVELTDDRTAGPRVVLGTCLLATGRDADVAPALAEFIAAGRIRIISPDAWRGMGQAIARQADLYAAHGRKASDVDRRVNEAVRAYRRATALDPDDAASPDLLGELLAAHDRRAEAVDVWRNVLDRFPTDPVAHGDLAAALQQRGDLDAAADQYRQAINDGDTRPATRSKFAWLVAIDGRSTPAELALVAPLAKAACDDPEAGRQPFPWYAYSVVLARLDRINDATAAAQRALALAEGAGQKEMAAAIRGRLRAYQQGLPALPATQPTTRPAATRSAATRPAVFGPGR